MSIVANAFILKDFNIRFAIFKMIFKKANRCGLQAKIGIIVRFDKLFALGENLFCELKIFKVLGVLVERDVGIGRKLALTVSLVEGSSEPFKIIEEELPILAVRRREIFLCDLLVG